MKTFRQPHYMGGKTLEEHAMGPLLGPRSPWAPHPTTEIKRMRLINQIDHLRRVADITSDPHVREAALAGIRNCTFEAVRLTVSAAAGHEEGVKNSMGETHMGSVGRAGGF